ncbi:MAG: RcnB family protein [Rhodanobacter sp.]
MKKSFSLSVACAVALMFASGAALAQNNDQDHDHDKHSQSHDSRDHGRHADRDDRGHDKRANDYRGHDDRRTDYRVVDHRRRENVHYSNWHDRGRHEGWYRRGGYLPVEYRTRYVVTDWRRDRLRAPPRGYHWVRSDNGDFLLVAITTGIIASILAQH